MDLSIEGSFHSRCLWRYFLAATVLIAVWSIGRGQGPLEPAVKHNEPAQSPQQNPSNQKPPAKSELNSSAQQPAPSINRLTRDEAVRLALAQASAFQTAQYAELIAAEDVRQARVAFLPRITVPSTFIYTSPTLGPVAAGTPRADRFSFINANAVSEYQVLAGASGEIDVAGRQRAALRRSVALLEAARAGTEIARRTLIQGVDDAYYGLALATAKRRA